MAKKDSPNWFLQSQDITNYGIDYQCVSCRKGDSFDCMVPFIPFDVFSLNVITIVHTPSKQSNNETFNWAFYGNINIEPHKSLWPNDTIWWTGLTLAWEWLEAWQHQAITWAVVDLPSIRSSDIHLGAVSQEIPHASITEISLKIIYLKFYSNPPVAKK